MAFGNRLISTGGGVVRDGLSPETAAWSADDLAAFGITTNGNYWLVPENNAVSPFFVYCEFDAFGNWMNIVPNWGGYTGALYYTPGPGGGYTSVLTGANTNNATLPVNGNSVKQNQAELYGCNGQANRGFLTLSQAAFLDFSLTSVKVRYRVTSSTCNCGYNFVGFDSGYNATIISGTTTLYAACGGYGANVSTYPAVGEAYNIFNTTTKELYSPYTACAGNIFTACERVMVK